MKMTRSTSSTSIIGVMFMSALACGTSPLKTFVGAVVLVGSHYSPPREPCRRLALGDEAHVLDPAGAQLVHRVHHVRGTRRPHRP